MLDVSQEALQQEYEYDAENGELLRIKSCKGKSIGKIGCTTGGKKRAKIGNRFITVAKLVWIYHNGGDINVVIDYVDGDRFNTRIENLRVFESNKTKALTAELVRGIIDYNPETGEMIYLAKTSKFGRKVEIGSRVGWEKYAASDNSPLAVEINGRIYSLGNIAWLHYYGEFPRRIRHKDGNNKNIAIANLEEV